MAQKPLRARIQPIPADQEHREFAPGDPQSGPGLIGEAENLGLAELAPLSNLPLTNTSVSALIATLNNNAFAEAMQQAWQ